MPVVQRRAPVAQRVVDSLEANEVISRSLAICTGPRSTRCKGHTDSATSLRCANAWAVLTLLRPAQRLNASSNIDGIRSTSVRVDYPYVPLKTLAPLLEASFLASNSDIRPWSTRQSSSRSSSAFLWVGHSP